MSRCDYIYCRAGLPDDAGLCPRCGHPTDATRLKDPAFLQAAAAAVPDRGGAILDMHQILPRHPMAGFGQQMMMDALDVRRALLQSVPAQATSLQGNAELAALQAAQPGRYIASWYVDPRAPDTLSALAQAARQGVRVIKLLPVVGYRLDDPQFHPFWAAVADLRMVLLVHTGFITARHKAEERAAGAYFNARYGDPLQVDEPARRYADVPIILAHCGGAIFYEAAAQLITQHDNIWGDLSGFGLFALQRWLKLGVTVDTSRVFWGNDAPFLHYPSNLRLLMATLDDAGATALTRDLLHDNADRFLQRHLP